MNVIMFKAQGNNLLMKADIPDDKLDALRRDIKAELSLKAAEAYMSYDEQEGITITLIFQSHKGTNN